MDKKKLNTRGKNFFKNINSLIFDIYYKLKNDLTMVKKLFSRNNHKTIKGEKKGYITYILYMSPFTDNSKGINICPFATSGCSNACLFKSGLGGIYTTVQQGRRNKTEWYLSDRKGFMEKLDKEIAYYINKHKGEDKIVTFRLNGTSDISYEKTKVREGKNIFELYPDVQFYDYTKNAKRYDKELPTNYHLTFSRSETNDKDCKRLLKKGHNVAVVFNKLPEKYMGYEVVNGDETDLRFLDKQGVIVGLKYKNNTGKGADNKVAFETGFAVSI